MHCPPPPRAPLTDVVLLMDNASIHKGDAVDSAVRGIGAIRRFVPPYSPDLNLPVEGAFGDAKRWLRRHRGVGRAEISERDVEDALDSTLTAAALLNRFRKAGYRT